MIVDYIDSHRDSVRRRADLCRAGRARDADRAVHLLRPQRARRLTDAELDDAYLANAARSRCGRTNWGVYGARKLWHAARRAGLDVGRDQVARLMRIAGIRGASAAGTAP